MLPDSQARFAAALRDPAAPVPESIEPAERFNIHRNNAAVSLVDALAESFPVVRRLVGDTFFRAMAVEFCRAEPPRSPALHEYGEALPQYIDSFRPAAGLPYLGDVACLEWAWQMAYHAAEAMPLKAGELAAIASTRQGELRLALHPATRLLTSRWPVLSIWTTNSSDRTVRPVDLQSGGENVLITRPAATVEAHPLSAATMAFAQALGNGQKLSEASRTADLAQRPFALAESLGTLLRLGALVANPAAHAQASNPGGTT